MNIMPILAEDIPVDALAWLFGIAGGFGLLFSGMLGLASIIINAQWGRRRWWGLLLGIYPTASGGFALMILASLSGSVSVFAYAAAAFPLLAGLGSLGLWSLKRDE